MIDACESQILERRLAQILKYALLRGLRCIEPCLDALEQREEFVACHR
jgi:hypothetical protein